MPWLFSYGSLKEAKVQLATYGRRLDGHPDSLVGFEGALVPIDDPEVRAATGRTHHANAVQTGKTDSRVDGMVFEVTAAELADTDKYEKPFSYKRIDARLSSGKIAAVYVHQP